MFQGDLLVDYSLAININWMAAPFLFDPFRIFGYFWDKLESMISSEYSYTGENAGLQVGLMQISLLSDE